MNLPWWITCWLTKSWYEYLFAPKDRYCYSDVPYIEVLWCRLRGHPAGEIYYNPGGYEPNHHCRTCGDEIG
jgi:hypothetical protein